MNTYSYDLCIYPSTSRDHHPAAGHLGTAFAAAGPLGQAHGGTLLHCALGPGGVLDVKVVPRPR